MIIDLLNNQNGGSGSADAVSFDNTTSGLSSTNVQAAIDEIDAEVDDIVNVYGSKNLYPNEMVSGSVNGITVTVNVDGSFTLSNGSTNAFTQITLKNNSRIIPADGNYTLSGYTGSLTIAEIGLELYDETTQSTAVAIPTAIPSAMLYKDHYYSARLNIASGIDFTTPVTIYPMLRDARITDSTYEPYSMTNQQITKRLSGQSNRNLLDNSFFTVNQRGLSDYNWTAAEQSDPQALSDKMSLDRWHMVDSSKKETVHLHASGGITITNNRTDDNCWFYQVAPSEVYTKYAGKTVTLSVDVVSKSGSNLIWVYCHGSGFEITKTGINTFTFALPSTISNVVACHFVVGASSALRIRSVKLELGTESTLAYDIAPDYGEELAKCQRYFIHDVGKCCAGYSFGNVLRAKIPTSIKMRANPTVIVNTSGYAVGNSTGITLGNASSVTAISENDGIRLEYGGLTVNDGTYVLDATVSLSFSAEL